MKQILLLILWRPLMLLAQERPKPSIWSAKINLGQLLDFFSVPGSRPGWMYCKTANTYHHYNPGYHEETGGNDTFGIDNQNLSENSGGRISGPFNLRLG